MKNLKRYIFAFMFTFLSLLQPVQQANAFVFPVFDANNFSQNLLTAARTLEQINNQVTQLQNQAQMLINQVKNLTNLPTSIANDLRSSLANIDALVQRAQNVAYQVNQIDSLFNRLYPKEYASATSSSQIFQDAKEAWNVAREGFQHSMQVQAKVVEQVRNDANVLDSLVTQSQSAIGNLQATQAGNQLLALNAKQTMQLQTLLASSARAVALDRAAQLATKEQARTHFQNFLGDSSPYSR